MESKVGKQDVGSDIIQTEGATPRHKRVCPNGVKGSSETWDMDGVADHDYFAIETEDDSAFAKDRQFGVVT